MTIDNEHQSHLRLGFLTAVEVPGQGYVGALLVTNRYGRPLEFQCTTPVKPNRTQEILYGPTLLPFLFGEVIGRTLVEKVSVQPELVLTEQPEFLELREHVSVPVACLVAESPESRDQGPEPPKPSGGGPPVRPVAHGGPGGTGDSLRLGRQWFRFHTDHRADRNLMEPHAALVSNNTDLHEPFQRVREALNETQRRAAGVAGVGRKGSR